MRVLNAERKGRDDERIPAGNGTGAKRYNRDGMLAVSNEMICCFQLSEEDKSKMRGACCHLADALDRCIGSTLQQRWSDFETKIWPEVGGWTRPALYPLDLGRARCGSHAYGQSID
jgi:hypothetical protein